MSGRKGARKIVAALVLGLVTAVSAAVLGGVSAPSHATVVAGDSWCC